MGSFQRQECQCSHKVRTSCLVIGEREASCSRCESAKKLFTGTTSSCHICIQVNVDVWQDENIVWLLLS